MIFPLRPILLVLAIASGCAQDPPEPLPDFLQQLTAEIEAGFAAESPGAVWRYRYRKQTVYYLPPAPCCDYLSVLYDVNGAILCSPDGGLTGDGDGRCPDFFATRSEGNQVWTDSRVASR